MQARIVAFLGAAIALLLASTPAAAMVGGAADGSGHPYVAAIGAPDGTGIVFTGTPISPTVLLTVAHGALRLELATQSDQARVTFDPVVSSSSTWYTGTIHINPGFDPTHAGHGDYAVVVFNDPLPVTPARLPTAGAFDGSGASTLESTALNVVGYGLTSFTGGPGPGGGRPLLDFTSGGTRKVDDEQFLGLTQELLKVSMHGGDQLCPGDSGSPTLLGSSNLIAGITVGSIGGCTTSGAVIDMRVDTPAARSFIGQYVSPLP